MLFRFLYYDFNYMAMVYIQVLVLINGVHKEA